MNPTDTSLTDMESNGVDIITKGPPKYDEADIAEQGNKQHFIRNLGL